MTETNEKKEIKFESALRKLEQIVVKLEDGDLELEKSIELFEEGVIMSKLCRKKLDEAETKIEKLVKSSEGEFSTEKINGDSGD